MELQTKTTGLWQTSKETNPYGSLKYQMRTSIYQETINVFLKHLHWGIQPFQLYSGKIPSPIEWLLNPGIKEK